MDGWASTPTAHPYLAQHVHVERLGEDLYRVQRRHAVQIAAVDVHLHHLLSRKTFGNFEVLGASTQKKKKRKPGLIKLHGLGEQVGRAPYTATRTETIPFPSHPNPTAGAPQGTSSVRSSVHVRRSTLIFRTSYSTPPDTFGGQANKDTTQTVSHSSSKATSSHPSGQNHSLPQRTRTVPHLTRLSQTHHNAHQKSWAQKSVRSTPPWARCDLVPTASRSDPRGA